MSTTIYPPISDHHLLAEEEASAARELSWLLHSLQDTLTSLRAGLKECIALIQPSEPPSTLVLSSSRSESLKGYVTRVGDRIVKGDMQIKMYGLPPTKGHSAYRLTLAAQTPVSTSPTIVYKQSPLTASTDPQTLGITHNAGSVTSLHLPTPSSPPQSPPIMVKHISASPLGPHIDPRRQSQSFDLHSPAPGRFYLPQLTSLRTHLSNALHILTSPPLLANNPSQSADADTTLRQTATTMTHLHALLSEIRLSKAALTAPQPRATFPHTTTPPFIFDPPLPPTLAFDLTIHDGALVAELRTVEFLPPPAPSGAGELADVTTTVRRGFASVFGALPGLGFSGVGGVGGAHRPGLYEEVDKVVVWEGRGRVRVKDKVRVESQDPRLMAVMVKVGGLEHGIGVAMGGLEVVRGGMGKGGVGLGGEVGTGVVAAA